MKKFLVFLSCLVALSGFGQSNISPVPLYKPRLIPYADWDQYHNLIGADNGFAIKGVDTATFKPTNTWGEYHFLSFHLPGKIFVGWDGSKWIPFGAASSAPSCCPSWYYYTACGGGYQTTALPQLVGSTIFGGVHRGGAFYRPAQGSIPGFQECKLDATTGILSFSTAGAPLADGEHIDIAYLGGTAGTFYSSNSVCCIQPHTDQLDLQAAVAGSPYSDYVAVSGSLPLSLSNIVKPSWMTVTIIGSRVYFTGTPNAAASVTPVTYTITNSCGSDVFASTIEVGAAPVTCTPASFVGNTTLGSAQAGTAYTKTISLTGTAPFFLTALSKPDWMTATLNGSTITLTGTPTQGGVISTVSFTVKNCDNANSLPYSDNITVNNPPVVCNDVSVSGDPMQSAATGVAFSQTIALTGTAPFTLSNVTKPGWMTVAINGSSVVCSGTPNAAGTSTVSFTVSNCSSGSDTYSSSITVTQTVVQLTGTFQEYVNDEADNCHSQGAGYIKVVLNGTYSQPILIKWAWATRNNGTPTGPYVGGDIVPSSDAYYGNFQSANSYLPAQTTIAANATTYFASQSTNFSAPSATGTSFVALNRDGHVDDFVSGDKVGEHGAVPPSFPDCNPTFGLNGSSKNSQRYYYQVITPGVDLTLTNTTSTDVTASRNELIKIPHP